MFLASANITGRSFLILPQRRFPRRLLLTKNIRLTSAATVLSAADPIRVFQEFTTLDLISHRRAEIVAGRGSFVESLPN